MGFLGKNTEVSRHFLHQRIFLDQGSNPHLLHWQADSLPLNDLGSPSFPLQLGYFFLFLPKGFTQAFCCNSACLLECFRAGGSAIIPQYSPISERFTVQNKFFAI